MTHRDLHLADEELLLGCRRGERLAMERFHRAYFAELWLAARRYGRDDLDARAILNASFLKIFRSLGGFDGRRPILPWLKTVVMNTGLDAVRERNRHRRREGELAAAPPDLPVEGPADGLSQEEILEKLRALPEMERTVLGLFAVDGLGHAEIGQKLGISPGHSRWLLHSARLRFKKILQADPFFA